LLANPTHAAPRRPNQRRITILIARISLGADEAEVVFLEERLFLEDVGEFVFGVVKVRRDQAAWLCGRFADGERAIACAAVDLEDDVGATE
jgi:hypothetical protein